MAAGKVVAVGLGIVFLVAGVGAAWLGWFLYQQAEADIENAVAVEGVVRDTTVERDVSRRDRDDDGFRETEVSYQPVVSYSYTYEGRNYTSDSVYPGGESLFDSRAEASEVTGRYDPGETVTVYVNAEEPSRAFLVERDRPSPVTLVPVGVGAVAALAGLKLVYSAVTAE